MCHDSRNKLSSMFILWTEIDSGVHFCPDVYLYNCGVPLKTATVSSAGLSSPSFRHSSDMRDDLSSTLCLIHCACRVEIDRIQPKKWNRVNSHRDDKCKQCCWAMQTNEDNHQPASIWQTHLFFLSGHRPWTYCRQLLITLSWHFKLINGWLEQLGCRWVIAEGWFYFSNIFTIFSW